MPAAAKANLKAQKKAPKKDSAKSRVAGNAKVQPPGPPLMLKVPAQARCLPPIRAIQDFQEIEESSSASESEVVHTSEEEMNGEEEEGEEDEEPEPLPKKRKHARRAKANKKSIFLS
jgi:hypothetical protein